MEKPPEKRAGSSGLPANPLRRRRGRDADSDAALAESGRIQASLYRLTHRLHRAQSLEDVYAAALDAIAAALRCTRASILLFDEGGVMRFVAWRGLSERYRRAVEGHSPWQRDEIDPEPIFIRDVDTADLDDSLRAAIRSEGIRALAFVPLMAGSRLIGKFMIYFDAPQAFGEAESELSLVVGRQLAFGIERERAEQAQAHLAAIVTSSSDAIASKTLDGIITSWNASAERMFGYSAEEMIGEPVVRLIPPERCQEEQQILTRLRAGERVENYETVRLTRDGRRLDVSLTVSPLRDASGRITGASKIARDITERKRAEALLRDSARQLALITDSTAVNLAHCDAQGRYRFVNRTYAARFGLQPEDCVGRSIAEIVGETAYASLREHVDAVLRGAPVAFDLVIPYRGLGERFVHCSYVPELDDAGKVRGFVAAITDITERRRIEEALRSSEERLRETDRRKDEFLAMLAHELRNPMAPIANAVQLLRRDGDPAAQRQARGIIERQTARLARIVDDLLEVSRITTGRIKLQMQLVALEGIVERAAETVRPLVEQCRHQLSLSLPSEPLWLYGDAARLEQALVNLLNNAAKYTDDGGRIEISARREEDEIVLGVRDSGVGIDPQLLPHVFDLFTQAEHSLDRSRGGLGIGLALVQRLVAIHGGSASVQSEVGRGSEFTLRLPLAQPPAAEAQPRGDRKEPTAARPLRALVVDDNVDAAESLAMLLEMTGHEVRTAHDGAAGLEAAEAYRPHVVLLDIGLPKLDGYAVARRLREDAAFASTVLVALTGYGQAADRARTRDAGFDRHLVKPVEFSQVERILAEIAESLPR